LVKKKCNNTNTSENENFGGENNACIFPKNTKFSRNMKACGRACMLYINIG